MLAFLSLFRKFIMTNLSLLKKKTKAVNGFTSPLSARVGFTLIELLVVIAIIGVLASIVLASLNNARIKSRDAKRIGDIKQIQTALELSYDSQGSQYPQASGTCDASTFNGLEVLKTQGYIPEVPRDPLNTGANGCYRYATLTAAGTRSTYHFGVVLEDYTNSALAADIDQAIAASLWDNDFDGVSVAASPAQCGTTPAPGGAQPGAGATGENCYDIKP